MARENWPPDYVAVLAWRKVELHRMQADPEYLVLRVEFYATRPVEFINHWCDTFDTRNLALGKPTTFPLILFPVQEQFVRFLHALLLQQQRGLVEKSRDMGATWICVAFSVWVWLFMPGAAVGWGTYDQKALDVLGVEKSIFEKMRILLRNLPAVFLPRGFSVEKHCPLRRVYNPETGSSIFGEFGDQIGRGGRSLIHFGDEAAHYVHAEQIEAAVTQSTRCQVDISTVHGLGNLFHRKREGGTEWQPGMQMHAAATYVFILDWSDHPEKTREWHDQEAMRHRNQGTSHVLAQEVDRNYAGSMQGVVIPHEWVAAAIDAHVRLDFEGGGVHGAALDVADDMSGGVGDTNAFALREGPILVGLDEWHERDTGVTTRRAVALASPHCPLVLEYDGTGMGSGIKGEANRLKDDDLVPRGMRIVPWLAGSPPLDPDKPLDPHTKDSPLNSVLFKNLKAQGWWQLRLRFWRTWQALNDPSYEWDPDELVSLPSTLPLLRKLQKELSQPVMKQDTSLKMLVDKQPPGTKSPNLGDAVMMAFWPVTNKPLLVVTDEVLTRARMLTGRQRPYLR